MERVELAAGIATACGDVSEIERVLGAIEDAPQPPSRLERAIAALEPITSDACLWGSLCWCPDELASVRLRVIELIEAARET